MSPKAVPCCRVCPPRPSSCPSARSQRPLPPARAPHGPAPPRCCGRRPRDLWFRPALGDWEGRWCSAPRGHQERRSHPAEPRTGAVTLAWPAPPALPFRATHGSSPPKAPPLFTPQGPSSRTQRPLRGSAVKGLCAPPSSFPPTSTPTLTSSEGRPAPRPAQHQQLLGATSPRPSALRARVLTCPGPAAAPSALPRSCSSPHISALALGPERPGTGAMPSRPSAASRSPPGVCPGLGACSAGREGPGDGDA